MGKMFHPYSKNMKLNFKIAMVFFFCKYKYRYLYAQTRGVSNYLVLPSVLLTEMHSD